MLRISELCVGTLESPPALLPGKLVGSAPTARSSARRAPPPPESSGVLVTKRQPNTRATPHPRRRQSLWREQNPVRGGGVQGHSANRGRAAPSLHPQIGCPPAGLQCLACHHFLLAPCWLERIMDTATFRFCARCFTLGSKFDRDTCGKDVMDIVSIIFGSMIEM